MEEENLDFDKELESFLGEVDKSKIDTTDIPKLDLDEEVAALGDESESKDKPKTGFEKYRSDMKTTIIDSIKKLKDIKNYTSCWITLLSTRQRLLEDIHMLADGINELNKQLATKTGDEYERILSKLQYRVKTKDDKQALVEKATAHIRKRINRIKDQMDYNRDSIQTIDHVLYKIDSIIEMHKILNPVR